MRELPSVTVCIIAKNEAHIIGKALESLRGHVKEIVLVDTGSSDDTVRVATEGGARILSQAWANDFSRARNAALLAATGDYCLMIDADECVEGSSWGGLYRFMAEGVHAIGRVTIVSNTPEGTVRDSISRVCMRGEGWHYEGKIHEQLVGPGTRGDTGLVVLHSGYTEEAIARKKTVTRNLHLLKLSLADRPNDAYLHHQIGRTLSKESAALALPHFEMAIAHATPNAPFFASLVCDTGYALKGLNRIGDAIRLVEKYESDFSDFTDMCFLKGLLYLEMGDAKLMLQSFERCLTLGEVSNYPTVVGVGSYRAHYNIGLYYELSGNPSKAIRSYQNALDASPEFAPAKERLATLNRAPKVVK